MVIRTAPQMIVFFVTLITNLIEGLLGLRILLKLFGASPVAPFVQWLYETTNPLLAPFSGMFPSPKLSGGFVIEFSAFFGLVVYAFIGYVIIQILESLQYRASSRVRVVDEEVL